jgi:hypothetical protein
VCLPVNKRTAGGHVTVAAQWELGHVIVQGQWEEAGRWMIMAGQRDLCWAALLLTPPPNAPQIAAGVGARAAGGADGGGGGITPLLRSSKAGCRQVTLHASLHGWLYFL